MKVDINLIYTIVSLGTILFLWFKVDKLRDENKQLKENLQLKKDLENSQEP